MSSGSPRKGRLTNNKAGKKRNARAGWEVPESAQGREGVRTPTRARKRGNRDHKGESGFNKSN